MKRTRPSESRHGKNAGTLPREDSRPSLAAPSIADRLDIRATGGQLPMSNTTDSSTAAFLSGSLEPASVPGCVAGLSASLECMGGNADSAARTTSAQTRPADARQRIQPQTVTSSGVASLQAHGTAQINLDAATTKPAGPACADSPSHPDQPGAATAPSPAPSLPPNSDTGPHLDPRQADTRTPPRGTGSEQTGPCLGSVPCIGANGTTGPVCTESPRVLLSRWMKGGGVWSGGGCQMMCLGVGDGLIRLGVLGMGVSSGQWDTSEGSAWHRRVLELEAEGLTTSDAQGVADVEFSNADPAQDLKP